jgi:exosortase family protein XrtM
VEKLDTRFALKFAAGFALLYLLLALARETLVDRILLEVLALRPSAWLVSMLSSDPVRVVEASLVTPRARLNILAGCDGRDALLLILAAVLATPARFSWKLTGLVLGLVVVCTLNYARITALYFALRDSPALFDLFHAFLFPALVVAGLCMYFFWWQRSAHAKAG